MAVAFGRARYWPKVKLEDRIRYPIWVSAHDERHDEEWMKPVVRPLSVTRDVVAVDNPLIALRVAGTDLYAMGYYDHDKGRLYGIGVWIKGKGVVVERSKGLRFPMTLVAIPPILRQRDVEFVLRRAKDYYAPRTS